MKPHPALLRLRAWRHGTPVLVIAVIFIASRVAAYGTGVRFRSNSLGTYLQLVDPDLLRTRLLESLFYLHGQPPLFNLYLGVLLKAFPGHYAGVAQATYIVLGLIGALALYGLLVRVGCPTWVGVAVTAVITVAPATIVYENWLFYEYPVAVLLVLSAFALAGFVRTKSFWPGFSFFLLLAAVIWIRTSFQIVWMLLAAGLVVVALRDRTRLVLRASLVPLLLVVALCGKNLAMFGVASTSSWYGMTLAEKVFSSFSPADRARRVERGDLSRVSLVYPYRQGLDAYRGLVPLSRPTGIAVLDQIKLLSGTPNFNNKSYVRISKLYLGDALHLIRDEPSAYLRSISSALKLSFRPSVEYPYTAPNQQRTTFQSYTQAFNHAVYAQTPYAGRIGLAILGAYALALLYGLRLLWLWFRGDRRSDPKVVTLLYIWLTVVYTSLVLALVNFSAGERIRFAVDPLVAVLVTCAAVEVWPVLRRHRPRLVRG